MFEDLELKQDMSEQENLKVTYWTKQRWILLTLIASTTLAFSNVIFKHLRDLTASDLAFARYLGMFAFNMPFLTYSRSNDTFRRRTFPTLLTRGVFGSSSFFLSYVSLKLMPLAESAVIVATTPVWVSFLSWLFLKERIDIFNAISTVLCLTGLVIMSKVFLLTTTEHSHWDVKYWYGCIASLASAVLAALTFVFIRKLKQIHESVTIAYQSSIGVVGILLWKAVTWDANLPKCGWEGVWLVIMCGLSFLGQKMLTVALQHEKASTVSNVRFSSRILILLVVQIVLFKEIPDVYSGVAVVCVSASVLVVSLKNVIRPTS